MEKLGGGSGGRLSRVVGVAGDDVRDAGFKPVPGESVGIVAEAVEEAASGDLHEHPVLATPLEGVPDLSVVPMVAFGVRQNGSGCPFSFNAFDQRINIEESDPPAFPAESISADPQPSSPPPPPLIPARRSAKSSCTRFTSAPGEDLQSRSR